MEPELLLHPPGLNQGHLGEAGLGGHTEPRRPLLGGGDIKSVPNCSLYLPVSPPLRLPVPQAAVSHPTAGWTQAGAVTCLPLVASLKPLDFLSPLG